jgi:hypothetical protein
VDKWLQTGSVKKTRENEVSTSVSVAPGLTYDKPNSCDETQSDAGKSCVKRRKFDDERIKFGFTYTGDEDSPIPRCVFCGHVLANSSLKPSLFRPT